MTAPDVLFDVALNFGAPDTALYWHIGHATYGKIGVAKIGPEALFTSVVSDRLLDFTVNRTSSRVVGPVVTYDAGSATFTLINDDGLLDPFVMAESAVMAGVRLRAQIGSTVYPIFRGFIKSWVPEHRHPTHAVVNVTAVDGLTVLAEYLRTASGPIGTGEDTGARINRILNSVNWSSADRSIAVGDSTLAATTLEGDALAEAQAVMTAEAGEFYCDESGQMFFRNRHALLTDARSTVSQGTFGSNRAGGELPYVGVPGLSDDDEQLVNVISATRTGGVEQVVTDEPSRAQFLDHKHEQTDMLLQSDSNVRDWAGYILHFDHLPEFRFTSLEIDPRVDEANLYPHVLGRRIGDRITVVRRPPALARGATLVRDTFGRTVSNDWGTTETGHVWQISGTASSFSVSGGLGRHSLTAVNTSRYSYITDQSATVDVSVTVATDVLATGGAHFVHLLGRFVDTDNWYSARLAFNTDQTIDLTIRKRVAATESALVTATAVSGLTHAANTRFGIRLQILGSTLRAKTWLASGNEPTAWTLEITDSAFTADGAIGLRSILSSANTNTLPVEASWDLFTRPATITDARDVYVRSIEHVWQRPNVWKTSWGLQPADKASFFIIGHAVNGRIGQNAIAY